MARQRPNASVVTLPVLTCLDGGLPDDDGTKLTRAEAHALRRSAPLTYAQLNGHLKGVADPVTRLP